MPHDLRARPHQIAVQSLDGHGEIEVRDDGRVLTLSFVDTTGNRIEVTISRSTAVAISDALDVFASAGLKAHPSNDSG